MQRPFSYRNRQRIHAPEPEAAAEPLAAPALPVEAAPKKKRKRKLAPDWSLESPAPAASLAYARWYGAPASDAAALMNLKRTHKDRGGRAPTCLCGTCRKCQLRQWKRESRARARKAGR